VLGKSKHVEPLPATQTLFYDRYFIWDISCKCIFGERFFHMKRMQRKRITLQGITAASLVANSLLSRHKNVEGDMGHRLLRSLRHFCRHWIEWQLLLDGQILYALRKWMGVLVFRYPRYRLAYCLVWEQNYNLRLEM